MENRHLSIRRHRGGLGLYSPRIHKIDIPQSVVVRKYEVDIQRLCELLYKQKKILGFSCKYISEVLGVKKTKVEHWFRKDDCFAIPDPGVWMELKGLLQITTDEFDNSIMTFEEKKGVFEKSERHYFTDGIAPTLTSTSAGNERIIVDKKRKVVSMNNAVAVAMCGRYNTDGQIEQKFEVSDREYANAITTVQKDSMVSDCLRIRKLTPKECFRLMGFNDSDFEKAEAVNSNTQLYKQAGNSIVVPVVEHIINALFDCGAFEKERSKKEMELRMNDYQLPEQILFNYEELKQELTEKVSMYETLVYTDAQIKEAKEDRANLNKLKKALVDERIRREKEYMEPFNDFKAKINEIVSIIDRPVAVIDRQVKEYEEKQKQDKMDEIKNFWNSCDVPEGLVFEKIFDSKWLNATVSMKSIHEAIDAAIDKFNQDMSTLANLPEFGFEAQQVYISTLDMNKAIAEGHRMSEIARAKAEREAAMRKIEEEQKAKAQAAEAEQIPGQVGFSDSQSFDAIAEEAKPARQWVKFQAYMTTADALALKDFFNSRNIEFKAV